MHISPDWLEKNIADLVKIHDIKESGDEKQIWRWQNGEYKRFSGLNRFMHIKRQDTDSVNICKVTE